jgi:hypothetical protein
MGLKRHIRQYGAGSSVPVSSYTDTLLSPDQPFGFGDNWAAQQNLVNPPVGNAFAGTDVASGVNRGATGLSYTNPGGGGFAPVVFATPIPIDWSFCLSRGQFSQFQFVSVTAGVNRVCVVAFYTPNTAGLYLLQLNTEVAQFSLDRWNGVTQTNLVAPSVATAYVAGDVLRLEVDILTTPGTTIVRGKKNGVTVATFNDNSGSRLTRGMFGMGGGGSNPAVTAVVSNYAGGTL